jgi:hypothetical protein
VTVSCSANTPVAIEFDELPDGRFIAWAVAIGGDDISGFTVSSTDESDPEIEVSVRSPDGTYESGQTFVGMSAQILGQRLVVVHECSFRGEAHDRVLPPTPAPRKSGSIEVEPPD